MGRLKLGRAIADASRRALEDEVMRYAENQYLWHRHITGVDLRPHQLVYCDGFENSHTALLIASRRIGKSFSVASYLLKEAVTKPRSEINIHAALEQSKRNLRYMVDMVLNSPILMAMIEKKMGEGIGKEQLEFINGSVIQAKGQASSVDGLGATHQWWEEVDDMDLDTLYERIYPTGSMIKPGYNYGDRGQCCRIATGTIKGMGNIYTFENPREGAGIAFNVLPKYTGWHGVRWGVIPENDLVLARDVLMTPEQFARAFLCLYTESSNFFPTRVVDKCQDPHQTAINIEQMMKDSGKKYYPQQGLVTCGIDAGAQGTGEHPSEWSINFVEDLGWGRIRWLYGARFRSTENPEVVRQQMTKLIDFFRPARGYGDAFDTTFLYGLNKLCRERQITRLDPDNAENRAGRGGWNEWFIAPVRFTGPNKHLFYKNLRMILYQGKISFPYVVKDHKDYVELQKLREQLENIKKNDRSNAGYDLYDMVRNAIGDDHVDSLCLAAYAQGEFQGSVRPVGMAVEAGGFREFGPINVVDDQMFTDFGQNFNDKKAPPTTVNEFLNDE